jgi:hypothetical protein
VIDAIGFLKAASTGLRLVGKGNQLLETRRQQKLKELARRMYNTDDLSEEHEAELVAWMEREEDVLAVLKALLQEDELAKTWAYVRVLQARRDGRIENAMRYKRLLDAILAQDLECLRRHAGLLLGEGEQPFRDRMNALRDAGGSALTEALINHGFVRRFDVPPGDLGSFLDSVVTTRDGPTSFLRFQPPKMSVPLPSCALCSRSSTSSEGLVVRKATIDQV